MTSRSTECRGGLNLTTQPLPQGLCSLSISLSVSSIICADAPWCLILGKFSRK